MRNLSTNIKSIEFTKARNYFLLHWLALLITKNIHFSKTWNPLTGILILGNAPNEFWWTRGFWKIHKMEQLEHGKHLISHCAYFGVDIAPSYDQEEVFAFNPPPEFSIENHSSGKTVIEWSSIRRERRVGAEDVVWTLSTEEVSSI